MRVGRPVPAEARRFALAILLALSLAALAGCSAQAQRAASQKSGTVLTRAFHSKSLGRTMRYVVYLPPGYALRTNLRYPVVYLMHGSPGAPEDWVKSGRAPETMDALVDEKKVRPMILVIIQGSVSEHARQEESPRARPGQWPDYVSEDLVKNVDEHYRTIALRKGRAIAGLSEGGYAATNIALHNLDEFGVVGSFSGYFDPFPDDRWRTSGKGSYDSDDSPMAYYGKLKGPLPAMYLSVGSRDHVHGIRSQNLRFEKVLRQRDPDFENPPVRFVVAKGNHSWPLWRSELPKFLVFAAKHLDEPSEER